MPEDIKDLGKGAVVDTPDPRDFKITPEMMGAVSIDWTIPFKLPNPGNEDQGISDSCVAHAWSYYHEQLRPTKEYSRRDLFARIALIYGAEIRSGGKEITTLGHATKDEVPDPKPQTPQNMRDKTGINPENQASDIESAYFVLPQQDITSVAWGIQAYKGVVFGVIGSNQGWTDKTNPRPPKPGETTWGHALYAYGNHIHGDGQKCIIAKSSWSTQGAEHHIKENYFLSGNTFNAWTLIPKEQIMFSNLKVKILTTNIDGTIRTDYGVYTRTPNTDIITKAEDEAEWRSYSKQDSYMVHTINADDSTDWSVDKTIDLR